MSVKVMAAVFEQSQSKGSARLVLLAMANEAHSDGSLTAYKRSRSHLEQLTNLDYETIRRAIHTLVDLGELVVLVAGAGRKSSDYLLVLPGLGVTPLIESPRDEGADPSESPPRDLNVRGQTPPDEGSIIPFSPVLPPVSPVGASQAKRKTQLPADFKLNDDDIAYALTKMPPAAVDGQLEQFINHHGSKGNRMLDWRLAWRTWAGNYPRFTGPQTKTRTTGQLTTAEVMAAWEQSVAVQ